MNSIIVSKASKVSGCHQPAYKVSRSFLQIIFFYQPMPLQYCFFIIWPDGYYHLDCKSTISIIVTNVFLICHCPQKEKHFRRINGMFWHIVITWSQGIHWSCHIGSDGGVRQTMQTQSISNCLEKFKVLQTTSLEWVVLCLRQRTAYNICPGRSSIFFNHYINY